LKLTDVSEEHISSIFGWKNEPRKKPRLAEIAACFLLVCSLVYSSTLKMEAMFLRNIT
jgi:hypothetical protein